MCCERYEGLEWAGAVVDEIETGTWAMQSRKVADW